MIQVFVVGTLDRHFVVDVPFRPVHVINLEGFTTVKPFAQHISFILSCS